MGKHDNSRIHNKNLEVLKIFISKCLDTLLVKYENVVALGIPQRRGKMVRPANSFGFGDSSPRQMLIMTIGGSVSIDDGIPKMSRAGIKIHDIESWNLEHHSEVALVFLNRGTGKKIGFYSVEGMLHVTPQSFSNKN